MDNALSSLSQKYSTVFHVFYACTNIIYHNPENSVYDIPLDPKTMKNEGFTPPIYGL